MDASRLDNRVVEDWRRAASDLGIRITAPVELTDASGHPFVCEALVHDFGSPQGALVVSRKTERRVRENLRDLGKDLFVCGTARRHVTYSQKDFVGALLDWGWFGTQGSEPLWYLERTPHP
jgi:hypothetical protein